MSSFELRLHFHNGAREPLENTPITVSVINGRGRLMGTVRANGATLPLEVSLSDDPMANLFTLNASAKGFRDAGYIGLHPPESDPADLFLMLTERDSEPQFLKPEHWPGEWAGLKNLIGGEFTDFADRTRLGAACLLNLLEAIRLFPGDLLKTIKAIPLKVGNQETREKREGAILQDRALLFVESEMRTIIEGMPDELVSKEPGAAHGPLYPGEERISFKEVRFAEANLQFTMTKTPQGLYADIDMDYFKDKFSHFLLEWFPNTLFGTLTDPRRIYVLRWMAGKNAKAPQEFAPPYFLAKNVP